MSRLKAVALCMISGLVFTGCNSESSDSGSEDNPNPQIKDVGTHIRTNTLEYSANASANYTLSTQYVAHLSDDKGPDDIVLVEVEYSDCDCFEILHDTRAGADNDQIDENGLLTTSYWYNSTNLHHSSNLTNFTLRVVDRDGNVSSRQFHVTLPESNALDSADFIYSDSYTGSDKSSGYAALSDTEFVSGSIDTLGQTITLNFNLDDTRIESFYSVMCAPDADGGYDNHGSHFQEATGTLVNNGSNSLSLLWSDVAYSDSQFSDYNKQGAGVRFYAYSKPISDSGQLADRYMLSSITECIELQRN
ncbi:hypothetical protein [Saccharospirillum salsuginis]|uniref:Dystroglycan-type cadherin-like domain-containing protein n=1 Tax=Saccharospirillum salsuginis TaxID=418750 RepID=A0A918K4U0_9GAMM|nr:hypothetical protein [Saccharospirillum salsuginis]GGX48016.1 hypothetical protein GCM10007392_13620 [Saccharospirillum salsuginis]